MHAERLNHTTSFRQFKMKLTIVGLFCYVLTAAGAPAKDEVDVLIVGGGATGAYAAVRLREDFKKSVLVVEKSDRLVSRGLSTVKP